ncbi:MAG: sulfatase [Planctomycetota bacterium]
MNRSLYALLFAISSFVASASEFRATPEDPRKPNVIVILADDLGYGDLSCYGAKGIATPNIDRMSDEGVKFNSFYVSAVCSPARASLMTGSHSTRVGIGGVLFPRNNHGLNPDEITLPELLKEQGYATTIIGKWHLGNDEMFQPLNHGFDEWYGTPASNSQFYHPTIKKYAADCVFREGYTRDEIFKRETAACPLIRNNVVIEVPAHQSQFTQRYTRETIRFITENKDKPFFVYLAHNMPHIPLHASEKFLGSSERGLYGDTIQELDWSTGEILRSLNELGLDKNTLVIFTSDNGPNISKGGSAGPLKGGKGSTLEGGVRVPFVARWAGKIPVRRVSDEAITAMDLLPTLTKLAGGDVPDDRVIDGEDIWPLLIGEPDAKSPHDAIYYLRGRGADGIRVGDWKYRMAFEKPPKAKTSKGQPTRDSKSKKVKVETLYNLKDDVGEQANLLEDHPEIAQRLKRQLETFETDLRKSVRPARVASRGSLSDAKNE